MQRARPALGRRRRRWRRHPADLMRGSRLCAGLLPTEFIEFINCAGAQGIARRLALKPVPQRASPKGNTAPALAFHLSWLTLRSEHVGWRRRPWFPAQANRACATPLARWRMALPFTCRNRRRPRLRAPASSRSHCRRRLAARRLAAGHGCGPHWRTRRALCPCCLPCWHAALRPGPRGAYCSPP